MMIKLMKTLKSLSLESGYTMMEGLVAMVVVAATMSAIAPVVLLSMGTRVQARRVELAAQAARSYIDAVRLGSIDPPKIASSDPSGTKDIQGPTDLICPDPENENNYCKTTVSASGVDSALYCVYGGDEGDCKGLTDMVVYAVGFHGKSLDPDDGYELFVRVYRSKGVVGATLSNEAISTSASNTGLATRSGNKEKPLFTTKTEITPSGDHLFQKYRSLLENE